MRKRNYQDHHYVAPLTEVVRVRMEQVLAALSTTNHAGVQDEWDDEDDDNDAPFTFAKEFNWFDDNE